MKKIARLSLLLFFCILTGQGIYFLRDGFNPKKLTHLKTGTCSPITKEMEQILSQPFYFLGKGRQCFAFQSKDGKYVLKCPRTNIYKLPFWSRVLPAINTREKMREDKTKRRKFVFESFRLAQENLQEETGIIAAHLGTTEGSFKPISLFDPLGIKHTLPMGTTLFILQHKQPLWTPIFLKAQKQNDIEEQKRLLNALVDIVIQRARKGMLNRDRSFLRNYGFDGTRAYQIDIGDFFQLKSWEPSQAFEKAVRDSLAPVQEWLAVVNPPMLDVLNRRLETFEYDIE